MPNQNNENLIIIPDTSGYSAPISARGKSGQIDWNVKPQYSEGIGGGKSPMYLFKQDNGEAYWIRLEKDRQGGRWENSGQIEEYEMMKKNRGFINKMWGDGEVANKMREAVDKDLPWEELPTFLKDVDTWRQISGDQ